MDNRAVPGTLTTTVGAGTVRVGIRVCEPIEDAWRALADPVRLGHWFGDLDGPWTAGRAGRIEFGDGDFFDVITHEVVERRLIEFEWRFLGVGPVSMVQWTTEVSPEGTKIVVRDTDPKRTPAETDEMVAGWTDFFARLARYLATGERSRYDWREDIDGSVDLPSSFDPLRPDLLRQWLPIATDGFRPRWFFIVDDEGPRRFQVIDWRIRERELTFSIEISGAASVTACWVAVEDLGETARLGFAHTGWRELGLPDRQSLVLRRRFAVAWTASLRQADRLAHREA